MASKHFLRHSMERRIVDWLTEIFSKGVMYTYTVLGTWDPPNARLTWSEKYKGRYVARTIFPN